MKDFLRTWLCENNSNRTSVKKQEWNGEESVSRNHIRNILGIY